MAMKNLGYFLVVWGIFFGCENAENVVESGVQKQHGINLSFMDTTVSPREDFYRFVNGNWMKNTEIPADRGRWGSFDELRIETSKRTLTSLERYMEEDLDPSTDEGKAAIFYSVAMDTDALDELGLFPIQEYLDAIQRIDGQAGINEYLGDFFQINGNPYFGMSIRSGFDEADTNSLFLGPGSLGLPEREYYLKTDSVTSDLQKDYKALLAEAVRRMEIGEGRAEELAEGIFSLEKEMASLQMTKEKRRNTLLLNNPMPVSEADRMMSFLDLEDFLSKLGIDIPETVIVTQPKYVTGLNRLMKNYSPEIHKAYLAWMVLHSYGHFLDLETENMLFSFYGKKLEGTEEIKPRWERVLDNANGMIGQAIGKLYVKEHFPPEAKEEALVLVDNIKKAFAKRLNELEWMTDATKERAREKLGAFTVKIGYPDRWKDYSGLAVLPLDKGGSYAGNIRNIREWSWKEDIKKIGQAVDKSEWFMAPQIVNAYYNPSYNEIVFPAAILQPPFFDFRADPAVNYGGIGAVIGHEISHGFDDQGSGFDAEGNLKNWWTLEDEKAFKERTGLLAEQYNNYRPFEDLAVNGAFTLGENIGDLGGVNVAFEALKMHLEKENPGELAGYTQSQRFFMNWATIWRTKIRDEALRKQIQTDPHAPGRYRAIGPIANMDAFYEAFEIREGDKLYVAPEKRIKIW